MCLANPPPKKKHTSIQQVLVEQGVAFHQNVHSGLFLYHRYVCDACDRMYPSIQQVLVRRMVASDENNIVWLVPVAQVCVMPVADVSLRTAGAGRICRSIWSEHAVWLISVAQVCV